MMRVIRSTLFNFLFVFLNALFCILLSWCLVLPRQPAMKVIRTFFRGVYWLERIVLNLDFKVEGEENLPKDGNYIVAAKHQSAYETMLLIFILDDPGIVLKKELTQIPFWGWYAKKSDMIAIDRSKFSSALKSMLKEAKRINASGRPIVIFPQGTRTALTDTPKEKPYKSGLAKIYSELDAPVIPLALNTGFFWGRGSFLKKSGVATLRYLPPIPAGLDGREMLKEVEKVLEAESHELAEQARATYEQEKGKRLFGNIFATILLLFGLWGGYWMWCADQVQRSVLSIQNDIESQAPIAVSFNNVETSGFPLNIHVGIEGLKIHNSALSVNIPGLEASAMPLPGSDISLRSTGPVTIDAQGNKSGQFKLDRIAMTASQDVIWPWQDKAPQYRLKSFTMETQGLKVSAEGAIEETQQTVLNGEITLIVEGYENYIETLIEQGHLERGAASFMMGMVKMQAAQMKQQYLDQKTAEEREAFAKTTSKDALVFPLSIKNNVLYAGMVRVGELDTALPTVPSPALQLEDNAPVTEQPAPVQERPKLPEAPIGIEDVIEQQQEK